MFRDTVLLCKKMAIHHSFSSVIQALIPFLALFHTSQSQGQYQFEEKICGVLHSDEDFRGGEFIFHDGDQSTDLGEDHGHGVSEHGWNVTRSVRVSPGCEMTIYNETYFDGGILKLGEGQVANLSFENVSSLSCTCKKECKCEDIFMKKSTCARGYLAGGCKSCHSSYADLPKLENVLSSEFYGKIEALRLRKGCKLHTYSEEDFEGDLITYQDETVEGIIHPFSSFECECNDTQYVPRMKRPRPATYPPLIDIPEKFDDFLKLLSNKTYSHHPGLQSARNSFTRKRSSRNAYILLLGTSGAGKTSAAKILFDNFNIGEGPGCGYQGIHESRISVPVDEIGIANSELRIIDTPGLGDTRGLEQDARILATLDNFLSTHEELNSRVPNVVLIFHKFNDNRFNSNGPNSSFARMIRAFDSFRGRLVDDKYSNVIFVLSHFCSETRQRTRRPQARLMAFKDVIENYSLFPKPILLSVAENKAMDHQLPMINGYHKLPNNEYYPRNLFEKMELVTQKSGDMVGLGVFRTAFRNSDDFNVTTKFIRVNRNSEKIQHYISILNGGMVGNLTEIKMSAHLKTVWDTEIDAPLKKLFPESLYYLQKALNLRSINSIEDIPKTNIDILALLTSLKHDEATRQLVEKALGIKAPLFPHATIAGHCYNIFKDTNLPTSPFVMGDTQQSDIGFSFPRSLTCKFDPKTKDHLENLGSREDYIQQRLKSLGIDGIASIPESIFIGQIKPGYNIKGIQLRNDSCTLSAVREFRLFELVINDRLDLTPEFRKIVLGLPVFNESDHENVEKWNHFFNEYGTHVVHTAYGGGSMEIRVEGDKPFSGRTAKALLDLIQLEEELQFLTPDINESEEGENSIVTPILPDGLTHSLNFVGGNNSFYANDLTNMSIERTGNLLENWKTSLKFNPAILKTNMKLVPISTFARRLGQNYSTEIDRATLQMFNLKEGPCLRRVSNHGPGPSRDLTPLMTEMFKTKQREFQVFGMGREKGFGREEEDGSNACHNVRVREILANENKHRRNRHQTDRSATPTIAPRNTDTS